MKTLFSITCLVLILNTNYSRAQKVSTIEVGDIVKLIAPLKVKTGATVMRLTAQTDASNDVTILQQGYLFHVVEIDTTANTVELLAINFKDKKNFLSSKQSDIVNQQIRNQYNNKVYTVNLDDFKKFARLYKYATIPDRISIGIITLPFKARITGDNVAFDTEFNFNSTANVRVYSYKNTHLNLQIGAGLGSVNLNESNTNYLNGTETIQAQDVRTLSILTGFMVSHRDIQIGIYGGWDHINNQKNFQWENNGKLWLGLGVGVNIFNNKTETTVTQQSTN
ncbi:hypothetical protein LX97_02138 [Nonlabens dokdonensis]|jgi:hypothetical protein|uniref:Uncharacterized protein n=2 Tax=Nonlabens dokdonensis TaxID=328515 RepID=L7WC57_NONDD|nr:hypothetical protein [Nonlabens dokdonensis]AGC77679.1 hypothetical protein DDD_2552 [Nonlabens dokdonensis DSW-6]PZX39781.1 hypothetical protein LX97_02138 [Nonlabens dokdonensis]